MQFGCAVNLFLETLRASAVPLAWRNAYLEKRNLMRFYAI